jgi:hypothetical protein
MALAMLPPPMKAMGGIAGWDSAGQGAVVEEGMVGVDANNWTCENIWLRFRKAALSAANMLATPSDFARRLSAQRWCSKWFGVSSTGPRLTDFSICRGAQIAALGKLVQVGNYEQ